MLSWIRLRAAKVVIVVVVAIAILRKLGARILIVEQLVKVIVILFVVVVVVAVKRVNEWDHLDRSRLFHSAIWRRQIGGGEGGCENGILANHAHLS